MQCCEGRNITFGSALPEAATLVVDEIEGRSRAIGLVQHLENSSVVFSFAINEAVWLRRFSASSKHRPAHTRAPAGGNRSEVSPLRHLSFQDRQHLLGATATFIAYGQQGIRHK